MTQACERAGEPAEEKKEETVSSAFVGDLEAAVKLFVEKWQDHPEGANALAQKHEAELVRQELRPLVFEEVRLQVDDEMRILLQNLKVSFFSVLLALAFSLLPNPKVCLFTLLRAIACGGVVCCHTSSSPSCWPMHSAFCCQSQGLLWGCCCQIVLRG